MAPFFSYLQTLQPESNEDTRLGIAPLDQLGIDIDGSNIIDNNTDSWAAAQAQGQLYAAHLTHSEH